MKTGYTCVCVASGACDIEDSPAAEGHNTEHASRSDGDAESSAERESRGSEATQVGKHRPDEQVTVRFRTCLTIYLRFLLTYTPSGVTLDLQSTGRGFQPPRC